MPYASAATNDKEIVRNPHPPAGLGRDGSISLLLLLADAPHRLVVSPQVGLRRAPNKRHPDLRKEVPGPLPGVLVQYAPGGRQERLTQSGREIIPLQ